MSRIGKLPIRLPEGVSVETVSQEVVVVKGPRGILQQKIDPRIQISSENDVIKLFPSNECFNRKVHALHGLYRALVYNMVVGVSAGFKQTLELIGVGYKAAVQGNLLELSLGYSHDVALILPEEVVVKTELVKGKSPLIHLECINKQLLGQVAAKIRSLRKVEPYKGKGIRFLNEIIRRKVGKSAKK